MCQGLIHPPCSPDRSLFTLHYVCLQPCSNKTYNFIFNLFVSVKQPLMITLPVLWPLFLKTDIIISIHEVIKNSKCNLQGFPKKNSHFLLKFFPDLLIFKQSSVFNGKPCAEAYSFWLYNWLCRMKIIIGM